MSLYFFNPPQCKLHEMGSEHPESPARLGAIEDTLQNHPVWEQLHQKSLDQLVSSDIIALAHDKEYVNFLFESSPQSGYKVLDPDTKINPQSVDASHRAVSAAIQAIDEVFAQPSTINQAFCNVRPPGHHAEANKAMGFCLFNTVAVAAKYAKQKYSLSRIAIVDFDVHHGNGTEDIVANDDSILLLSTFQSPLYPDSGIPASAPNILNYPLPPASGSDAIHELWNSTLLPELESFQPELLLVSAGFDAHRDDPLAQLNFTSQDYYFFAEELKNIAEKYAQGRLVACLEGGYHLQALAKSTLRFIEGPYWGRRGRLKSFKLYFGNQPV